MNNTQKKDNESSADYGGATDFAPFHYAKSYSAPRRGHPPLRRTPRRRLNAIALFLLVMLLLLSTSAYARPVTDVFSSSLIRISNFFENREYEPYATAIDFFLFSILFIAIYMVGARYAFKEIKKPEQVIVILLGLITAFLLVLADFSITLLLPYMNWIVYILLFLLFLWLLKGVTSKFWRVLAALLLVLLVVALFQVLFSFGLPLGFFKFCELKYFNWLIFILSFLIFIFAFRKAIKNAFLRFIAALLLALLLVFILYSFCGYVALPGVSGIEKPEVAPKLPSVPYPEGIGGFFARSWDYVKDFFGSFKGINFGGLQPGVPDWLRGSTDSLRQVPGQRYSAPDSTALQPVFEAQPAQTAEQQKAQEAAKKEAEEKAREAESEWHWYNPFSWGPKLPEGQVPFKEGVMPAPTAQPSAGGQQPTGQPPIGQQLTTPTEEQKKLEEVRKQRQETDKRRQEEENKRKATEGGESLFAKVPLWAWIVIPALLGGGGYVFAKKKGLKPRMPKFGAKRLLAFRERWSKPSAIAAKKSNRLAEIRNLLMRLSTKKEDLVRGADTKANYFRRIAKKDAPLLYFDSNRKLIKKEYGTLQHLLHAERDMLESLKDLRNEEVALFRRLPEFEAAIRNLPEQEKRQAEQLLRELKISIDHRLEKAA